MTQTMSDMDAKIQSLQKQIEDMRNPTPAEQAINIQKSSDPYNQTVGDYFRDEFGSEHLDAYLGNFRGNSFAKFNKDNRY